jgi:hypothetical protein
VEFSSSATARDRLLLPFRRPLSRTGIFRRVAHVSRKVELGSTSRHFLLGFILGVLLQSMEMLLSPVLHHRPSPQAILGDLVLLPLLRPLIRRGTFRRLSHVCRRTRLGSSATVWLLARLLLSLLSPLLQRGTFRRLSHVSRKTELSSSSTVRPLARLLLPLLRPLLRRGTLRHLSHVRRKTELGSSATVRPLLLLLLFGRTGKLCSRGTARRFLQQPARDMLLQSMEMILSPALHRPSPR